MAKFSRRFGWLRTLFPPATAFNIQPGEFGEDVIPVHQVLNGTDRLGQFFIFNTPSAAGVPNILAGAVPADKYWFVFGCSLVHDDPVARTLRIEIRESAIDIAISATVGAVPNTDFLFVSRSFILPPRVQLVGRADAIAAGQVVLLRFLYLELDLGEPAPPSP